jgi:AcrR family transcriptional regulator
MDLETPATRRRGRELEDALLTAAWDQLVSSGYGSFTIDAVAERAGTSKPVIYRRWSNREALVLAAVRHFIAKGSRPIPDTGSLRGDLIALLTQANESRREMAAVISVQLGAYYQETGTTPADLREHLIGDRPSSVETVMRRALERGEIAATHLTPRIISLPFDLVRHEALMTLKAIPPETILEIVDDIFLPLVGGQIRPEQAERQLAPADGR